MLISSRFESIPNFGRIQVEQCNFPFRFYCFRDMVIPLLEAASSRSAKGEASTTIPTKSRIKKQQTFPPQNTSPLLEFRRQSFPLRSNRDLSAKPTTTEIATKSKIGNLSKQRIPTTTQPPVEPLRRISRVEPPRKEIATKSSRTSLQRQFLLSIAQTRFTRC